ncbi:hypothetical protein WJX84_007325 [Apatococcus fuscideae]|uniref:Uncharacterized protein n=1 Tax=Apatococcus fuscideae TaxID=2026836 RepID=A0AAW1TJL4_9CHLO
MSAACLEMDLDLCKLSGLDEVPLSDKDRCSLLREWLGSRCLEHLSPPSRLPPAHYGSFLQKQAKRFTGPAKRDFPMLTIAEGKAQVGLLNPVTQKQRTLQKEAIHNAFESGSPYDFLDCFIVSTGWTLLEESAIEWTLVEFFTVNPDNPAVNERLEGTTGWKIHLAETPYPAS